MPSSSSSTPDTPTLFTWTRRRTLTKKDYTHIKSILDNAMFYYGARGGEVKDKKRRGVRPAFGHKTDFCCIQQPSHSLNEGFYVLHHMLEYRRDHQNLHMSPRSGDAHILQWAKDIGDIEDHRLPNRDVLRRRTNVAGRCPNTGSLSASRPEAFH